MLIVISIVISINNRKKWQYFFYKIVRRSWWLIPLKLLWNGVNIFFMGVNYDPEEHATLVPVFFLVFSFMAMIFLVGFLVMRAIFSNNFLFSIHEFLRYLSRASLSILFCMIGFGICAFLFLILLAMIFSYFHLYSFTIIKSIFGGILVEDVINIMTQVLYYHLMGIVFYVTYIGYYNDGESKIRIKMRR